MPFRWWATESNRFPMVARTPVTHQRVFLGSPAMGSPVAGDKDLDRRTRIYHAGQLIEYGW
jgi:hypothetical protein